MVKSINYDYYLIKKLYFKNKHVSLKMFEENKILMINEVYFVYSHY